MELHFGVPRASVFYSLRAPVAGISALPFLLAVRQIGSCPLLND